MRKKRFTAALAVAGVVLGSLLFASPAHAAQNVVYVKGYQSIYVKNNFGYWTVSPGWNIRGVQMAFTPPGKCIRIDVLGTASGDRTFCTWKGAWTPVPDGVSMNLTRYNM